MKAWQVLALLLLPGGCVLLAIALWRRRQDDQPVSDAWIRAAMYDKTGY